MKQFGMGVQVDQFEVSMNCVVEVVVLQVQGLLVEVVKKMIVVDVKGIFKGGDDVVIEYLDKFSCEQLCVKFLLIVKQVIDEVGLVKQYNVFVSQVVIFGVVDVKSVNVEGYVIEQVFDGFFEMIVRQEKSICQNLVVVVIGLVKKVFGVVR